MSRENVGHPVGACWRSSRQIRQLSMLYPEPERWRVNLTFILAAVLLLPLLIPRISGKGINAGLFFLAFPAVAFFLLHGGGLRASAQLDVGLLSGLASSIADAGSVLSRAGASLGDSIAIAG